MQIYYMDMETEYTKEQECIMYSLLPPERKKLVECAKDEKIAGKRICVGAFLQHILSEKTGIPIEQIQYQYNEWGKPSLDSGVHFNMSHSGRYVVLVTNTEPVGIDIEYKCRNYEMVAKRYFCKEEYEDILQQKEEKDRMLRFLEYWTMKEAYIKCVGEGLRIPMNSFQLVKTRDGLSSVKGMQQVLRTLWLTDKYCISLCTTGLDAEQLLTDVAVCPVTVSDICKDRESII